MGQKDVFIMAELTPNANQKIVQYLNDALAMENAAEDRIRSGCKRP